MTRARRPDPPPMRTNDVRVAAAGTAGWTVALLVLLIADLPAADRWWLWTCAVGIAIGVFGVWYIPRLQAARDRQAAARAERRRTRASSARDSSQDAPQDASQDAPQDSSQGSSRDSSQGSSSSAST